MAKKKVSVKKMEEELKLLRGLVVELCDQVTHVNFGPGTKFTQARFNEIKVIRDDILKRRETPAGQCYFPEDRCPKIAAAQRGIVEHYGRKRKG